MEQQQRLGMESPSISIRSPADSKTISDEKSQSPIPPAMLNSPCPVRISFWMPFSSKTVLPVEDYRYTKWESTMHYDHTENSDSLEVYTSVVSDYVFHSLIRSCPDGKFFELSGHCRHVDPSSCKCTKDPKFINAVWGSRSVMFQKFHKEHEVILAASKPQQKLREAAEASRLEFYKNLRKLSEKIARKKAAETTS